jgi:hypothetical protein
LVIAVALAGRDGAGCVAVVQGGWLRLTAPVPTTAAPDDRVPPRARVRSRTGAAGGQQQEGGQ